MIAVFKKKAATRAYDCAVPIKKMRLSNRITSQKKEASK